MNQVTSFRRIDPDDTAALRMPPHNYEAERALLGAILMTNRAYERVGDFLRGEHFADPVNAVVFDACAALIEKGAPANPITLRTHLESNDLVQAAGGVTYLTNLAASAVTIINTADYGRLVYELFLRREMIAIGEEVVNQAFDADPDSSADDMVDRAEERLFSLRASSETGGLVDIGDAVDGALAQAQIAHQHRGALIGVTTGLRDLDNQLSGLHQTDLVIIAGRPSMGKTALATTIAYSAAQYFATTDRPEHRGKAVAFFSLEMSKEQLSNRVMAHMGKLDSHSIRAGRLTNEEFERLVMAGGDLRAVPLKIDDTPASTVAAIRTRARRVARRRTAAGESGLGLIVIDYLQLISPPGRARAENRVQEVSAITSGLKALAKALNVPVVALSQLSRAVEQREDKRPQLSDLRESGTIEQDSDVVMFTYREQYYLEREEPQQRADETNERFHDRHNKWEARLHAVHNTAEIIVSKQRHGPIGTVKTHFDPPTTWFSNLVRADLPSNEDGPAGHPAWDRGLF